MEDPDGFQGWSIWCLGGREQSSQKRWSGEGPKKLKSLCYHISSFCSNFVHIRLDYVTHVQGGPIYPKMWMTWWDAVLTDTGHMVYFSHWATHCVPSMLYSGLKNVCYLAFYNFNKPEPNFFPAHCTWNLPGSNCMHNSLSNPNCFY